MGKETGISWTDHTFNPWWGCQKVSPGCANCYAEAFAKRTGHDVWGPTAEYRTFGNKHWLEPIQWDYRCGEAGTTERVFCASMADVFDERCPESERQRLWDLIEATPHLIWQLLTKRPGNYEKFLPKDGFPKNNVWLGITAENQNYYDLRWPFLQKAGFKTGVEAVFISYEPALGPIKLRAPGRWIHPDWLIFGGETGGKRRPMEQKWAEDIKAECDQLGIAFFMKQMSAATPTKAKDLIPAHLISQAFPDLPPAAIGD